MSPELLPREVALFALQPRNRALAFDEPDHRRDRILRRYPHDNMHVIRPQLPFHDLTPLLLRQLAQNRPQLPPQLTMQHLPVLWYVQSHFEWAKLWYTSFIVSPCMAAHHATKEGLYSRIAQSCQVHWSNQWLTLGDSVSSQAPWP